MSAKVTVKVSTTEGQEFEARLITADYIKFDFLRSKFDFPPKENNEISYMMAVTFCALIRTGKLPAGSNPIKFLETVEDFDVISDEDEAEFRTEPSA